MRGKRLMKNADESMDLNKLKNLENIPVRNIMRPIKEGVLDAETPITKMLEIMAYEPKRRSFYVVEGEKLLGIITPQRILEYIVLKAGKTDVLREKGESIGLRYLLGTYAKDYVGELVYVHPENTIFDVCMKMVEKLMDEIPVVSENMKLIGEVCFIDILNLAIYTVKQRK